MLNGKLKYRKLNNHYLHINKHSFFQADQGGLFVNQWQKEIVIWRILLEICLKTKREKWRKTKYMLNNWKMIIRLISKLKK